MNKHSETYNKIKGASTNLSMQIAFLFVYFNSVCFVLYLLKILAFSQLFIIAYDFVISDPHWKSTSYTRFKGHSSNS